MQQTSLTVRSDWRRPVLPSGREMGPESFVVIGGDAGVLRVSVRDAAGAVALPSVIRFGARIVKPVVRPGENALSDKVILSQGSDYLNVSGDWAEVDLDEGKFSMRYDALTVPLLQAFEDYGMHELRGLFELEAESADGRAWTLARWDGKIVQDVIENAPVPVEIQGDFVRRDVYDAMLADLYNVQGMKMWNPTQGIFQRVRLYGDDGMEQLEVVDL